MTRTSQRERAYEFIRARVLGGRMRAGERLSEEPLAREIGLSRTPVREALHQLASEGLLERGDDGIVVKEISLVELDEISRLRLLLEPHAAARAARYITQDQLDRLTEIFAKLRGTYRALRDADRSQWGGRLAQQLSLSDVLFHTAILEASCSSRLMKTVIDLRLLTTRYSSAEQMDVRDLAGFLLEHWRVFRAVRDHRPAEARRAMRHHLRRNRRRTMQAVHLQQQRGQSSAVARDWSALLEHLVAPPVRKVNP